MRWGLAVSATGQTGQSEAIHSPEACASMVVRLTMPAAGSIAVVCTVAISCWPRVLRTMSAALASSAMPSTPVGKAWEEVSASFDRFCLAAGIETLGAMMEADAAVACGPRHSRREDRRGHRWG